MKLQRDIITTAHAPVAQWIEQETSKLLAVGSIPTRGTISLMLKLLIAEEFFFVMITAWI